MTDEMKADEMEAKAKNCLLAFKAAMEAIQDYCGVAPTEEISGEAPDSIEIENVRVEISDEIREIAENHELTPDERVTTIKKLRSTQEAAKEVCEKVFKSTGPELEKCTDHVSTLIAERVVWLVEVH